MLLQNGNGLKSFMDIYIDDLTEENKKNKETITFICNELHNLQEQINKLKDELNHEENKH